MKKIDGSDQLNLPEASKSRLNTSEKEASKKAETIIGELPEEMKKEVASLLTLDDVSKLSKSSKDLNEWANEIILDLSNRNDLDYNKIIKIIEKYPNIKHLNLSNTIVDDSVLNALADLKDLETLNLSGCSVSKKNIIDLQKLNPKRQRNKNLPQLRLITRVSYGTDYNYSYWDYEDDVSEEIRKDKGPMYQVGVQFFMPIADKELSLLEDGSVAKCLIFTIFTFVMVLRTTASGDKLQILCLWRHHIQLMFFVL